MSLYRYLGEHLGFNYPHRLFQTASYAAGKVQGTSFTLVKSSAEGIEVIKVTAKREAVLPQPLYLAGGKDRMMEFPRRKKSLRLLPEDIDAINKVSGKTVFGRKEISLLADLERLTDGYVIHDQGLDLCVILFSTNKEAVRRVIETAAALAGRMHTITSEHDIVLNAWARMGTRSANNLGRLSILLKANRKDPKSLETLQLLVKGTDFEFGFMAAKILGQNLVGYVDEHFDDLDQAGRANAIQELADRPTPQHLNLLRGLFTRTRNVALRVELICILDECDDDEAVPLCIKALDSKAGEIQEAAIMFLAAHGGKESLSPLYHFYRHTDKQDGDDDLSFHGLIEEAIRRIHRRLGQEDAGRLSLFDDADAGGLSLSGED